MHSIDFLLIIPECFQIVLINIFLLFAICFSYYKRNSKETQNAIPFINPVPVSETPLVLKGSSINRTKTPHLPLLDFDLKVKFEKSNSKSPRQQLKKQHMVKVTEAYISAPVALIEPIIQLVILALICSSILYVNNPVVYAVGLTDSIIWDGLGRLMSVLICVSAIGSLALSITAISRFGRYEFLFIIWLSIIGMLCLVKSYNFLTIYLSVELQSLSFYMLAAMRSRTEASAEAGLKYFILSAFSSAILLLGITLIYAAVGSQNFADLNVMIHYFYSQCQPMPISLNVGLGCVCISLLFKLAAAPFHAWVADVYEGSPTPITAFFAITAKIGAATALIRVIELHYTTFTLLPFIAVLSLIVGSLSAMRQVKLKRLLAFSGVANVGWFLLALITGQWHMLIIHLIVYILLSTCLFSIFILPLFRTHPNLEYRQRTDVQGSNRQIVDHGTDSLAIKYISDLNQLHKMNPSLAFPMVVAFFSLAGIPPFAGFYSKYLIINALTQTEQYLTLLIALVSAILSAFYYVRVIKTIYFPPLELNFTKPKSLKKAFPFTSLPLQQTRAKATKESPVVSSKIQQTSLFPKFSNNGNSITSSLLSPSLVVVPPQQVGQTQVKSGQINNNLLETIEGKQLKTLTKKNQDRFKMFTIMAVSSNAYICAFTTMLTILFFVKPDYFCIWVLLSQ
jgi:NADH-quinone oxidoreductase subunit N